jgi:O-antigen/teichoic acid export membrane protein
VQEFGRYSILMAAYTLLTIFVHLGLESLLVREISRARAETGRYLAAALRVKTGSALVCFAGLGIAAVVFPPARSLAWPLILIGSALVLDAISDSIAAVFQGHQRFTEPSALGVAGGILFALAGSASLLAGGRTTALVASLVAAKIIQTGLGWVVLHRRLGATVRPRAPVTLGFCAGLMVAALPFLISKLFAILYLRLDMLMLGALAGEEPVGLYAAAYKFVNIATAGAAAFAAALFPVMASMNSEAPDRFRALFGDSLKVLLVLGTLVSALVWFAAEELLTLLFTRAYAGAAPAARMLAWAIVAIFVNMIFSNALLTLNRERWAMAVGGIAVLLNVGLDLALIPTCREARAATATLISEIAVAGAYAGSLIRAGLLRLQAGSAGRFLVCAGALLAPLFLLRSAPAALACAVAAVTYVAALALLRVLTPGDIARMRGFFAAPGSTA